MIRLQVQVNEQLRDTFARVTPEKTVKFLRRSVKDRSTPTLSAVRAETPTKSGLLRNSMGISVKVNKRYGEVFAVVSPQDNTLIFDQANGLTLFTSRTFKSLTKNDNAAIRKFAGKGVERISARTPFKYVYGIEEGVRRNGRIARSAGGAKMLSRGLQTGAEPFMQGVGDDVLRFVTTSTPTPTT